MFNINDFDLRLPNTTGDVIIIGIAFTVGFILGFVSKAIFEQNNKSAEATFSWLVAGIWLSMVIISYPTGHSIPSYFNILGFGASGNIIGLNFASLVSAFIKIKSSS